MGATVQALSLRQAAAEIGAAGEQLTRLGSAEASAGNISVFTASLQDVDPAYRPRQTMPLPVPCPALAGGWLIITGSGRRLRDVASAPHETLCLLQILDGGLQAVLHQAGPVFPTSEIDSHLAIHQDQAAAAGVRIHAVVHAQPFSLTYLSHQEEYASGPALSRRLVRWQPETILVFPDGIGLVPFIAPGTPAQAAATRLQMQNLRAVVWQKHGIITRAAGAVGAADLVEYAEAAAASEVLNLRLGRPAAGLTDSELLQICAAYGVKQSLI